MKYNITRLLVLIHNAQFAETKDDALKAIQDYTKDLKKEIRQKIQPRHEKALVSIIARNSLIREILGE